MSRKKIQGRSSLSFTVADGLLDIDHILKTDPWKGLENFAKGEAGSIQSVLDEFNKKMLEQKKATKGRRVAPSVRSRKNAGQREKSAAEGEGKEDEEKVSSQQARKNVKKEKMDEMPESTLKKVTKHLSRPQSERTHPTSDKHEWAGRKVDKHDERTCVPTKKTVKSSKTIARNRAKLLEDESKSLKKEGETSKKFERKNKSAGRPTKTEKSRSVDIKSEEVTNDSQVVKCSESQLETSTPKKALSGNNAFSLAKEGIVPSVRTKKRSGFRREADIATIFARPIPEETFSPKYSNNKDDNNNDDNEDERSDNVRENDRKSTLVNYAGESIDAPKDIGKREEKESGKLPKITETITDCNSNAKSRAKVAAKGRTGERKIGEHEKHLLERKERKKQRRILRQERRAARAMEKFCRHAMSIAKTMGYLPEEDSSSDSADERSVSSEETFCSCSSCCDSSCSCSCSCSCSSSCSCTCTSCSHDRSYRTDEYSEYTLCSCSGCGSSSSSTDTSKYGESD